MLVGILKLTNVTSYFIIYSNNFKVPRKADTPLSFYVLVFMMLTVINLFRFFTGASVPHIFGAPYLHNFLNCFTVNF